MGRWGLTARWERAGLWQSSVPEGEKPAQGGNSLRACCPRGRYRERSVTLRRSPIPTGQIGEWRLREGCELPRVSMAWNWAF